MTSTSPTTTQPLELVSCFTVTHEPVTKPPQSAVNGPNEELLLIRPPH